MPKPITYICHPYGDDPARNRQRIARICRRLRRACVPLAPQLLLHAYIDEAGERELALEHCLRLVGVADEVRVFGGRVTAGMEREIRWAEQLGIAVIWEGGQRE